MAIQVVRFQTESGPRWGVHSDGKVAELSGDWPSTGGFLTEGGAEAAAHDEFGEQQAGVTLCSPAGEPVHDQLGDHAEHQYRDD